MKECEGLVVNVVKTDNAIEKSPELTQLYEEYERYKARNTSEIKYESYTKGWYTWINLPRATNSFLDLEFKTKLEFVRIYFGSSMYDRISKVRWLRTPSWYDPPLSQDKRAKLVDIVAAFGGTMGLLTGFSIISGFEVLYFIVKIMVNSVRKIF